MTQCQDDVISLVVYTFIGICAFVGYWHVMMFLCRPLQRRLARWITELSS